MGVSRFLNWRSIAPFAIATLLSGCGGGGGDSAAATAATAATAALAIIATAPSSTATGVALDATVSAVASRNLNPASLTSASFSVTAVGGGPVVGTVSVAGATATFEPAVFLTPNTQYVATLSTAVTDSGGSALPAVFMVSFTTLGPPGAPTNLFAATTGASGQASVSFMPPASNGGGVITGYTVTSNPGGITATGTGSPIVVTGLNPALSYSFTVTASNIAGSGLPSTSPSNNVTPDPTIAAPPAPAIGVATASNAQASVAFTPPTCNLPGCPAISNYTVVSTPGGITASGPASPILVSGLTNGTAYTFAVVAFNTAGASPPSGASNSVTPAGLPGAPVSVAATGNASAGAAPGTPLGTATVTFGAPASDGGNPITGYTVTPNPGGAGIVDSNAGSAGLSHAITGLIVGTPYTFTVTATNGVGTGGPSAPSNSVTPVPGAGVPGAPTAVSASGGNAQATVAFTAPASNGSPIINYTVTSSPGGLSASGGASPIVVPGLTNGTAYTFTVRATNGVGTGGPSAASNSVTPATVPGAPTGAVATAGNTQATVLFTPPASNGGSAITIYTVTSNPGGITATGGASPITVTGLTNGVAHTFTVTASNSIGNSAPSAPTSSVTPSLGAPPGLPTAVSATAGTTQATVSFTPPASNGGSAISGYTVTSSPSGFTASGAASPIVVTGLTNGTAYVFTVTATNLAGPGPASGASNPVVPATVPGVPGTPTAIAGNLQATVTFTPPASNGGAAIIGYRVSSTFGGIIAFGSASPIVVPGLNNGTGYAFTVAAINSAGTGADSVASNGVIPGSNVPPGAPTGVNATLPVGSTQASVTFTASTCAVGCPTPITYTVTSNPPGGTDLAAGTTGLTHAVGGLTPGVAYTFSVTALNSIGTSPPSGASNSVTPIVAPGVPTAVTATAGNTQATISFTPPVNTGGAAITTYTVTCTPACPPTRTGPASPIVITGLVNFQPYTFTVTATNAGPQTGSPSAASNSVTPSIAATVSTPPTGVSASPGDTLAAVSFGAPASDGGSTITGYTVTSSPSGITGSSVGAAPPPGGIVVSGLANGTAYTFTVTATNSIGTSPPSGASNTVTPVTAPSAPGSVTAIAGNQLATVSFTPPASNGGSTISGYTVRARIGFAPTGIFATGIASPIVVTGLTNGTAYTFTVAASNGVGPGPASLDSNPVTPTSATVPSAPTGVSATPGNGQATVSFTSPPAFTAPGCALPVCAPITNFTVTSSPGGITATGGVSPIVVPGLTNGVTYTFTITGTNAIGVSPASTPSGSVTPVGAPGAPTAVNAVAGNAQATVSFTPPASNGGAAITSYTVTSSPSNIIATGASSPITYPAASLVNATPYTFTVTATNIAGTGAPSLASNSVIPTALATACSPTVPAVSGAISLRAQALRVTGVSPLGVFFDATATTSSATPRPFHELEYRWDFGDPASGFWTTGSRPGVSSKNAATGPMAAHVYDLASGDFTAGSATRTVTLTATDGTSTATCSMQIIITDPDVAFGPTAPPGGRTLCVSSAPGTFAACPAGATQVVTSTFDFFALTSNGANFKRILLRAGDTFTTTNTSQISAEGPGHLGTFPYGGARAVLVGPTNKFVIGNASDWRIANIDFDGVNRTTNTKCIQPVGRAYQTTILNNICRNLFLGMEFEILLLDFQNTSSQVAPIWHQWVIQGNQFLNNFEYGFLGIMDKGAALGNVVTGIQSQHAWRLGHGSKNIVSNNEFTGSPTGTALTFRGIGWEVNTRGSGNQFTLPANSFAEYSIASDNKITAVTGGLAYTYAASNAAEMPRFRNHISERNIVTSTNFGPAMFTVAGDSTIRNNLFVIGTPDMRALEIQQPVDPVITSFFVYNNSSFNGNVSGSSDFNVVGGSAAVPNLVARNNLGVAPSNTAAGTIGASGSGYTASNNSTRAQIQGPSPLTTTPPTQPSHWQPLPASYPINGGFALPPVPVFSDFFAAPRTGNHMGAVNP